MGVYWRPIELTGLLFGFAAARLSRVLGPYNLYREYGESISSFSGSNQSFHKKLVFICKQGCFLACSLVDGKRWKMRSKFTQTSQKSERGETEFKKYLNFIFLGGIFFLLCDLGH